MAPKGRVTGSGRVLPPRARKPARTTSAEATVAPQHTPPNSAHSTTPVASPPPDSAYDTDSTIAAPPSPPAEQRISHNDEQGYIYIPWKYIKAQSCDSESEDS